MNVVQSALPVSGTPQGASQAALRRGFFGGRTDASSPADSFEALFGAQFAAMLQSGVPLAQIVERLDNAPPGSTAAPQAAALARELATIAGRVAGEAATTTAGQQNDISGHVLDADTLAREHPAQHDTAAAAANDSTSLPQEILAQMAVALQLPQSPALAPMAAPSQPTAANTQSDAPAPVQVAQAPSASPDLLMRMLARAASVQTQSPSPLRTGDDAATTPPAQAQAAQPPPAPAPSVSPTVDVQLAQIVASTTQRASNDGSQANADLLGGDASDRSIAKLLAAPSKSDGSSAAFGMPSFLSALQHVPQNAQAPQTPPPSFDAEEVIAQIVKSVSMRTTDAGSHVNLRLQPESLGNVSMKISVSGSQINAVVTAQNADVRDLLLAGAQQLARSFAGAGLKLGSFSVNVSGGNAQGDARRNDGGAGARRRIVGAAVSDIAEAAGSPQYGIPIASAIGLMNYFA